MKVWTAGQIRDFLRRSTADDLYPVFWLAAYTGMRRGEVLGLRWRDVEPDDGFLSVRQQISRVESDHGAVWAVVSMPKTSAGRRRIDLDPGTVELLKSHRAAQSKHRLQFGAAYAEGDLVFARADGSYLDPDSVYGNFERLNRASGLPRIRRAPRAPR